VQTPGSVRVGPPGDVRRTKWLVGQFEVKVVPGPTLLLGEAFGHPGGRNGASPLGIGPHGLSRSARRGGMPFAVSVTERMCSFSVFYATAAMISSSASLKNVYRRKSSRSRKTG